MTGIVAADDQGAAATIDTGPEAPPTSVVLGDRRAQETRGPTAVIEGVMKMRSTEVPPVTSRGHTMKQAHVAAPHPAPLRRPVPGPKVKRACPGPTAQLKTSTQTPAPRNSPWDVLHHVPTRDPGHALAQGLGRDASLEVIDCLLFQCSTNPFVGMFLFGFQL